MHNVFYASIEVTAYVVACKSNFLVFSVISMYLFIYFVPSIYKFFIYMYVCNKILSKGKSDFVHYGSYIIDVE